LQQIIYRGGKALKVRHRKMRIQRRLIPESLAHVESALLVTLLEQHIIEIARLCAGRLYQRQQFFFQCLFFACLGLSTAIDTNTLLDVFIVNSNIKNRK